MEKSLDIIGVSRRDTLQKLIAENYKNMNDFCKQAGENYAAIHGYINKNIKMSDKVARRLELVFNKPSGFLDQNIQGSGSVSIPIVDNSLKNNDTLAKIIANSKQLSLVEQKLLDTYNWQQDSLFIIIANDNSMSPIIFDKSEVMVDSSKTDIESNKIYAVKIGTDIYIRKLIKSPVKQTITLTPENKADFSVDEIKLSDMTILGRVVYLKSVL